MKRKVLVVFSAVLAVGVVFAASFIGARIGARASPEAVSEAADPLEAGQSISIPGYEEMRLKAHETEQSVYLHNPAGNQCFFVITLLLDGVELYKSEPIAPNTAIENITISEPLYSGSYSGAVLRYSCYDLYTQKELNGAEMAIKLEVE